MLTAVKNQFRVCAWSIRCNIMKEMLNRVTFLTNVGFMMLNNASILIQWMILFHLREDVGGYTMREIMLLWGVVAAAYGLSHILFNRAFSLSALVISGKLDSFLVQPKNVLLSVLTSDTNSSSIGDFLYGLVLICISGAGVGKILLFLFLSATGALILTAFAVLLGSLSFWFVRADQLGGNLISILISFLTYPDGIFQGGIRFFLYLIIPVGMVSYLPVQILTEFSLPKLLAVTAYTVLLIAAAFLVFYRGLRRYASGNLMEARL